MGWLNYSGVCLHTKNGAMHELQQKKRGLSVGLHYVNLHDFSPGPPAEKKHTVPNRNLFSQFVQQREKEAHSFVRNTTHGFTAEEGTWSALGFSRGYCSLFRSRVAVPLIGSLYIFT